MISNHIDLFFAATAEEIDPFDGTDPALTEIEQTQLADLEAKIERGLQTFYEVGNALGEIRDKRLYRESHQTFEAYCRDRWGFSRSRAHRLVEAAETVDNLLPIGNTLPANEAQIRPLTSLPPEAQRAVWATVTTAVEDKKLTARDVQKAVDEYVFRQERKKANEDFHKQLDNYEKRITALPDKYAVLYADPPWRYEHSVSDSREIENQYPTMPLDEICELPIDQIANDDSVLFMWATSPKLVEALHVLASWGFTYRTCMVWVKDKIGMGYYARQQHEILLIGVRGDPPTPLPSNRPPSVINAPRTKHSAKPPEVADVIERMYPNCSRVELFCRDPRPGWDVWGNQS